MQPKQTPTPSAPAFALSDVYHVLFRHKWKILVVWAVGLLGAVAVVSVKKVPYRSQAELFILYVLESKNPKLEGGDSISKSADEGGGSVLNSEVEILNSFDLSLEVADIIGPEKILAKVGGGNNRFAAANWVRNGLTVEAPRRSTVLRVVYQHPDKDVVQIILAQLIESYLKKHVATHQTASNYDDLVKRVSEQDKELKETEAALKQIKLQVGITDLDEAKRSYSERITTLQSALSAAEVELVEHQATLVAMTNSLPAAKLAPKMEIPAVVPPEKVTEYSDVCMRLGNLQNNWRQNIMQNFIQTNPIMVVLREKIDAAQATKAQLETDYPQLTGSRPADPTQGVVAPVAPVPDIAGELINSKRIEAGIDRYKSQLAALRQKSSALNEVESQITDLERKRELQYKNFMNSSTKLDNERMEANLGSSRSTPNIKPIELPTPPGKDPSKLYKMLGMLFAAAFGGGLALAFVCELLLDQSFKRPEEIKSKLNLPMFLSIPMTTFVPATSVNGTPAKLLTQGSAKDNDKQEQSLAIRSEESAPAPWKPDHELRPFFETLRDRLVLNFELRKLTHNPKLIAVTSCGKDAGVSTIASGLAASLSETGEGNVLLVNMNDSAHGAAHYFRNGKLECGLDDALQTEKRDGAMVKDNLYVVAETTDNDKLPQLLHKRFSSLLPKLKASDYDYVIFDMPPVHQTSPTPRLARFMDMCLMVVEAEKTDRNVVKRATDLLEESKGTVGVVLNKTRNYVPRRLQPQV